MTTKQLESLNEMLWPNRLPLQALGLWPAGNDCNNSLSTFARFRLGFSIVGLSCLVGPQLYSVKFYWGDVAYLAETGSLVIPFALLLFKLLYMTAKRRDFTIVYRSIRRFWCISEVIEERISFEMVANIGKQVTIVAMIACVADCAAVVGVALLVELTSIGRCNATNCNHRRILPVDLVYGFDYEDTPIFESLFFGQTISLIIATTVAAASDASVLTAILHLIGQFRLINYRLKAIGKKYTAGFYHLHSLENIRMDIRGCIKHHQIVVSVADSFSELISPIVFGQLLSSGLQICISGYAIIEGSVTGVVLIKCSVLFFSMLVQLMMWCVPGEFLDRESGAIATAVCHELPWSSLSTSLRRDLVFVMFRAQRTCRVTAFYQVTNVAKLTEVLKAAGSYMALLRSFKQ